MDNDLHCSNWITWFLWHPCFLKWWGITIKFWVLHLLDIDLECIGRWAPRRKEMGSFCAPPLLPSFLFLFDKVLVCFPGWLLSHKPPSSVSWVRGLQASTTVLNISSVLVYFLIYTIWVLMKGSVKWTWAREYKKRSNSSWKPINCCYYHTDQSKS